MVCQFGFDPDSISFIASSGAAALKRFQHHDTISAPNNAVAWWTATSSLGTRTSKDAAVAKATSFTTTDDNKTSNESDDSSSGSGKSKMCFPASASIYVKDRGPVCVSELQAGDQVLCGDADAASLSFSRFVGHLHFEPTVLDEYMSLETNLDAKVGSPLLLSRGHLIYASKTQNDRAVLVRAGELCKGDWVCRASCEGDLQRAQIVNIDVARDVLGRYCPLTASGTIVVEGSLCSCYADPFIDQAPLWLRRLAATQEVVHSVLFPVRIMSSLGVEMRDGKSAFEEKTDDKGFHPYMRSLMTLPAAIKVL